MIPNRAEAILAQAAPILAAVLMLAMLRVKAAKGKQDRTQTGAVVGAARSPPVLAVLLAKAKNRTRVKIRPLPAALSKDQVATTAEAAVAKTAVAKTAVARAAKIIRAAAAGTPVAVVAEGGVSPSLSRLARFWPTVMSNSMKKT